MGLGDALFSFFEGDHAAQASQMDEFARKLELEEQWGPACRFFHLAEHHYRCAGVNDCSHFAYLRRKDCEKKATARNEHVEVAFEPPTEEVLRFPRLFIDWYRRRQRGDMTPWHAPSDEELAEARRRQAEQERKEKERERRAEDRERKRQEKAERAEKERARAELARLGMPRFPARWESLVAAARRVSQGDVGALAGGVRLWLVPSDRFDWCDAWGDYVRAELKKLLEQTGGEPDRDGVVDGLRLIGRRANRVSASDEWLRRILLFLALCAVYPLCLAILAIVAWLMPAESRPFSFLRWLLLLVPALLGLVVGLIEPLLRWLAPIAALLYGILGTYTFFDEYRQWHTTFDKGRFGVDVLENLSFFNFVESGEPILNDVEPDSPDSDNVTDEDPGQKD
jgi:hypothetical protein